jgi:Amt family ammonium transporter
MMTRCNADDERDTLKMSNKLKLIGLTALAASVTLPAFAQEAVEAVAETATAVMDKGDVAWMLTATVLVMFMIVPGLALFYGGLVRSKNMLSVLMQCTSVAAMAMVIWVIWGYSFAFGGGTSPFWGGTGRLFLSGINADSMAATFTDGVVIPEYLFIAFQMTFAAITPVLIVGAFAERIKFGSLMVFSALWVTLVYFPIAHMVWDSSGYIFNMGAIDFAGGTVVHINAGIAALVGALVIGPRIGFRKDNMAPHSMTLTLVGAGILWVGWFGFNAGSNLEANGGAALAMINTFVATAAAILTWNIIEKLTRKHSSLLGAASGMIAGLVAITPACGTVGPVGAIVLGGLASAACYYFVAVIKTKFGYDDSLDVFGIHGVGGIIGAVGTGIFTAPMLGGTGAEDYILSAQTWIQIKAVLITIVWSGTISFILFKLIDMTMGLRVTEEDERQGLDQTSHGESAYSH